MELQVARSTYPPFRFRPSHPRELSAVALQVESPSTWAETIWETRSPGVRLEEPEALGGIPTGARSPNPCPFPCRARFWTERRDHLVDLLPHRVVRHESLRGVSELPHASRDGLDGGTPAHFVGDFEAHSHACSTTAT